MNKHLSLGFNKFIKIHNYVFTVFELRVKVKLTLPLYMYIIQNKKKTFLFPDAGTSDDGDQRASRVAFQTTGPRCRTQVTEYT